METAGAGINFEDCLPKLLDLRFADDILLFGPSADVFFVMFDSLLVCLILSPWKSLPL